MFARRNLSVSLGIDETELEDYFSRPRLDLNAYSLQWWGQNSCVYPLHSKITADSSCERFFSVSGLLISKLRNRIGFEISSKCLSLKAWQKNCPELNIN